ncbi:MAG: hypothetical protein CSA66_02650 [Proteobacteria bacterium]|nr:MAG: hypothetical protein CSA66_02650 [Pseudomonadota bacterium]
MMHDPRHLFGSKPLLTLTLSLWTAGGLSAPGAAFAAGGPEPVAAVTPSGQVLLRYRHHQGHDFAAGGTTNTVRQRTRLGLALDCQGVIIAFAQLQDVRTWGEEADTLGDYDADGLDIHQGYLQVSPARGLAIRAGRQEIAYLNHRLIGTVAFLEQARSFDALRLMYESPDAPFTADLFYARTRHDAPDDFTGATDVAAGFARYALSPAFAPALVAVLDIGGPADRSRVTAGALVEGAVDFGLGYHLEGYYQVGGGAGDLSFAAWFFAAHLRYRLADVPLRPALELFAELASGDDDPGDAEARSFDTLFATNHKFYGEMDFFLNLPANTAGRGLVDLGARLRLAPAEPVSVAVTAHLLSAQQDRGAEGSYGTEIDVKAAWAASKHLTLDVMYGLFLPGDGLTLGGDSDPEHFVYMTADAAF